MKKFTEADLEVAIKEMFEIAGHQYPGSLEKLNKIDKWYTKWTRTMVQQEKFEKWLQLYLKPFVPKYRLAKEAQRFTLNRGFKLRNFIPNKVKRGV